MNIRTLMPGSDLPVSRITLGTWLFGGLRWGTVDDKESEKTFLAALEYGINTIDTADAYGQGKAEKFVSKLSSSTKYNLIISTKAGVVWNPDGTRRIDLSPGYLEEALEASLRRLDREVIDIYYLHEPDHKVPIEKTLEKLLTLKEQGKIKNIGLSNHNAQKIRNILSQYNVACFQDELNLLHRDQIKENLMVAKEENLGFFAYSPLYRGILSGKFSDEVNFPENDNRSGDPDFSGKRFLENVKKVKKLTEIADELNCSPASLSIRWLLELEGMTSVVIGARTVGQLEDQLKSLKIDYKADIHKKIENIFS